MTVNVQVFGALRDHFTSPLVLELAQPASIRDLADLLAKQNPRSGQLLESCCFAVDDRFAEPGETLAEGARIDVMPPFSGG